MSQPRTANIQSAGLAPLAGSIRLAKSPGNHGRDNGCYVKRTFGSRKTPDDHRAKEKGFPEEQFADEAEIHRTYVSDLERATRNPTIKVLDKLARALDVEAFTLIK